MYLSLAAFFLAAVALGAVAILFIREQQMQDQIDQHFQETRRER